LTEEYYTSRGKRRRFFKRQTRKMLYSDWLSHVLAFLIIGAVYYGMIQFGASVSVMLEELTGNDYVSLLWFSTYIVLSAAVVIPLICGVFNFEVCAIDRGKARISDMFYAFDSLESLLRSYRMAFYAFFKSLLFFLPAIVINELISFYTEYADKGDKIIVLGQDALYFALEALFVVFLGLGFVLSSKNFMGIYVCLERPQESISKCFFIANMCISSSKREMTFLLLSFAPLCVLSLFTAGFLFVMYTFPYMALCITMFSKYLYDKEMCMQNVKKLLYTTDAQEDDDDNNVE